MGGLTLGRTFGSTNSQDKETGTTRSRTGIRREAAASNLVPNSSPSQFDLAGRSFLGGADLSRQLVGFSRANRASRHSRAFHGSVAVASGIYSLQFPVRLSQGARFSQQELTKFDVSIADRRPFRFFFVEFEAFTDIGYRERPRGHTGSSRTDLFVAAEALKYSAFSPNGFSANSTTFGGLDGNCPPSRRTAGHLLTTGQSLTAPLARHKSNWGLFPAHYSRNPNGSEATLRLYIRHCVGSALDWRKIQL